MKINERNIWDDFLPISKKTWLHKIEKDIKGRDINDFDVRLSDLRISPFAHADDFSENPKPVKFGNGNWLTGEEVFIKDNNFQRANKILLDALMRGVQSPIIRCNDYPNEKQLEILLDGVELDYISLHFSEKTSNKNPFKFLENFIHYTELVNKNPKTLKGSIFFDPFADVLNESKTTLSALEIGKKYLPLFKIISIKGQLFFRGSDNVVEELTQILLACNNYFHELISYSVLPDDLASRMIVSCTIGINYFEEIAKLRALRILWQHLLIGYNTQLPVPITIGAHVQPQQKQESLHQNKISASSQIMSAIIGGADYICTDLLSIAEQNNELEFNRRILTNIQHLLSLESYFGRVTDPLAGSYYVEELTQQIAEAVWRNFKNLAK